MNNYQVSCDIHAAIQQLQSFMFLKFLDSSVPDEDFSSFKLRNFPYQSELIERLKEHANQLSEYK